MNGALGRVGIALGLLAALVGAAVAAYGLVRRRPAALRHAGGYAWLVLAGAVLATIGMERALVTHDFSLAYVADNNSRGTPLIYSITGMWSALQGSILLWALLLGGYLSVVAARFRRRAADPVVGWATLVGLCVAAFFFALMAGPANPFVGVAGPVPADGLGPNPLLQDNVLVAFHPVLLYLGLVGFTVPFAFAVAALATGRLGEGWLVETRRFTLFAWAFLSVGLVLGAWWSYQVLGWGGFWAWDPVENAALLPWLCATAYLHSVMAQERRGLLRVWNLSLLVATFSLTILATFLTRSGVLVSVHSFTNSDIGPELLAFFGLVVAVGVGLIGWRGDRLRSPGAIESAVSREGAFLLNNLLFAAFALVVLVGTVFPLFAEAVGGQQVTVGRPYFDAMTVPIGLALLFFMAVAPVLPWRQSGPGLLRRRLAVPGWAAAAVLVTCVAAGVRGLTPLAAFTLGAFAGASALRQLVLTALATRRGGGGPAWRAVLGRSGGGMIVHVGVVVIAVGLAAASSYGQRTEITLRPGQAAIFDGHHLTYLGVQPVHTPQRTGVAAAVRVDGGRVLEPSISSFGPTSAGVGTPAVDSGFTQDLYLTLASSPASGTGPVTLDVIVQPLVAWLWAGGLVVAVGAALAAVPARRRRRLAPAEAAGGAAGRGVAEREMPPAREPVGAPAAVEAPA